MHFQLTHEAERRWVLVLMQIEQARVARPQPIVTDVALVCRSAIVRAIYGAGPGVIRRVDDEVALMRIAEGMAEADEAKAVLRAKGWGRAGTSVVEVAQTIPSAKSIEVRT